MKRDHRYIAHERILDIGVNMVKASHELYRVAAINREGLTDKEHAYLMKLNQEQLKLQKKLYVLQERLK
jgi:hypothetical protein